MERQPNQPDRWYHDDSIAFQVESQLLRDDHRRRFARAIPAQWDSPVARALHSFVTTGAVTEAPFEDPCV